MVSPARTPFGFVHQLGAYVMNTHVKGILSNDASEVLKHLALCHRPMSPEEIQARLPGFTSVRFDNALADLRVRSLVRHDVVLSPLLSGAGAVHATIVITPAGKDRMLNF